MSESISDLPIGEIKGLPGEIDWGRFDRIPYVYLGSPEADDRAIAQVPQAEIDAFLDQLDDSATAVGGFDEESVVLAGFGGSIDLRLL